jgi:hypothetical protein
MPKTNLHQQLFIDALPSKVWKVLTSCNYINQYFPGGNVHSKWTEGSAIVSDSKKNAVEQLPNGKVLQVIPGLLLKYQFLEEVSNSLIITTYEIIPAEHCIELQFHSEGFIDSDENYFLRIKEAKLLLQKIKWLAEYV